MTISFDESLIEQHRFWKLMGKSVKCLQFGFIVKVPFLFSFHDFDPSNLPHVQSRYSEILHVYVYRFKVERFEYDIGRASSRMPWKKCCVSPAKHFNRTYCWRSDSNSSAVQWNCNPVSVWPVKVGLNGNYMICECAHSTPYLGWRSNFARIAIGYFYISKNGLFE